MKNKKRLHLLILLGILVLAAFLRFHNIDGAPSGIYPDEANNATNAYDAMVSGNYEWFYPDNNGREGLYINLIGLSFKLFGVSFLSLKLTSIFFGVLTVLGVYLLCRELFREHPRVALFASYFVAVSFWAVNFSRIGFRAIMLPAVLCFAFYFLFRALRLHREERQKIAKKVTGQIARLWAHPFTSYALAGFIFGLGFHTYISFRIAPLILFVLLVAFLFRRAHFLKNHWIAILVFSLFMIVSTAPMALTFALNPEFLGSRTGDVSIFSPEVNEGSLPKTLAKTFTLSLAKFNFWGDQNWRHGYPPYATLEPLVGVAFLFGFVMSVIAFFAGIKKILARQKIATIAPAPFAVHTLLLVWFFAMLVPEFLTAEGLPHALRSIGALPVVYIFAALTCEYIFNKARAHSERRHALAVALGVIVLFYVGLFNGIKYHVFWAESPKVAESFDKPLTDIGLYAQTLPTDTTKHLVAGPLARLPVRILNTETPNMLYLYPDQLDQIDLTAGPLFLADRDEHIIEQLRERFPDLTVSEQRRKNSKFYIIE